MIEQLSAREIKVSNCLELDHPSLLTELHDPPPLIYVRGTLPDPKLKTVALAGTSEASAEGIEMTTRLARAFADAKVQIVAAVSSGIAISAHLGARAVEGRSFGVMDCGFDQMVDSELMPLAIDLANYGGVISEQLPDVEPTETSSLEANRQAITNPYSGVSNLSGLAQDLSSNLTNPYANLSVATQAAEIQIEQADISLANTLDTIRATGASAGGATALAQAALQSKKGVSASIEAQEAQNERARAQGEERQQQQQMAEAQRLQQADVSGKQFEFGVREGREAEQLDRVSAQLSGAEARGAQASADRMGAFTGMVGGLASTAGSYFSAAASSNNFGTQGYDTSKFNAPVSSSFSNPATGYAGLPVYNFNN